jgi:hypothetical protein
MPGLFYFNKVYEFVKETRQKTITDITPIARSDVTGMSSEAMTASDPTIVNVVTDVI